MKTSLRSLARSPGFSAVAVLTLALGIGATTAIFSVLYAVLLRPFAYPDADQLVVLRQRSPQMEMSIAWPTAQDWMREQQAFTALSIFRPDRFNVADPGQLPENIRGAYASASLFDVAQLPATRGRYYATTEDQAGSEPVVVISESLWARRYNRDPAMIGRAIPVDGVLRTVVGIAPGTLDLPRGSELWVPLAPYAATQQSWQSRGMNPGLNSFGRLKPGLTLEQARADMERIYADLRRAFPGDLAALSAVVEAYRDNQVGSFRNSLGLLLAATAVVLAIACANVAGLFLTRSIQQARDYAVRSALGASRLQLVRQMLTESLVIAAAGGVLAIFLSSLSLGAIQYIVPADQPRFQQLGLNGWVLGFSLGVTTLAGVLAGLWPALQLSRVDLRATLHESGRGTTAGTGVRRLLVGAQVALTLVLLSVSGLILRSLDRMQRAALGFDASSVLTFNVSLPGSHYRGDQPRLFYQQLVDRIAQLPGVTHASVNTTPPLALINAGWQSGFSVEHDAGARNPLLAEMGLVSDQYFATLKIPLLQGRTFNEQDATGPKVAVIDEAFARKFWPGESPLGQRIYWGPPGERRPENWYRVIGVVPTLRVYGYSQEPTRPQAYWSLRQSAWLQTAVLVRTAQNPRSLEKPIRELLARLDPQIAVYGVTTVGEQVAETYQNTALQSLLLNLFAALAFLLSLTGLYGIVAYHVSMRRREIGVRVALGAQNRDVIRLMLRQGMTPLFVGVAVGLAGAFAAGRAIRSQLYDVSPTDPLILAAAALLLTITAALACWLPARRAARVDPMIALRFE